MVKSLHPPTYAALQNVDGLPHASHTTYSEHSQIHFGLCITSSDFDNNYKSVCHKRKNYDLARKLTCPQTLQETQRWVLKQNNITRKELGHVP
jgi:hypothetical protein